MPVTVLSRCLQFNHKGRCRRPGASHLANVLQAEGVAFDAGALRQLARAARGSMRDALSLTDQAIAFGSAAWPKPACARCWAVWTVAMWWAWWMRWRPAVAGRGGSSGRAARRLGLSAAGTLEDLAQLMQQMALVQAVPAALDDADETAEVRRLSSLLPAGEVQLICSMALHGRQELPLAPDEYAGLLMVLLRMLSFRPAPVLAKPRRRRAPAQPLVRPAAVAKAVVPVPLPKLVELKSEPSLRSPSPRLRHKCLGSPSHAPSSAVPQPRRPRQTQRAPAAPASRARHGKTLRPMTLRRLG